jgi:hypothetical protein
VIAAFQASVANAASELQTTCKATGGQSSLTSPPPRSERTYTMTAPSTTPNLHAPAVTGRRRRTRNTLLGAGLAVLISTGAYGAINTLGPDAHEAQPAPSTGVRAQPSKTVMRELRASIAGLYGAQPSHTARVKTQPSPSATSSRDAQPTKKVLRELHTSIEGQYGRGR